MLVHTTKHDPVKLHPDLAAEQFNTKQALSVEVPEQDDLASLYSVADICVFALEDSPFLSVVECMACGTPVIGVAKGISAFFITDEVGALVPKLVEMEMFSAELGKLITESLVQNWKVSKRTACLES